MPGPDAPRIGIGSVYILEIQHQRNIRGSIIVEPGDVEIEEAIQTINERLNEIIQ